MKILQPFALRKIRKIIRNTERQKVFPNLSRVHKILILSSKNDSEIRSLTAGLKKSGKRIDVWAYNQHSSYLKEKTQYKRFGNQDITLFEIPKQYILNNIENEKYDLVIDLTKENIIPLQYLLALVDSPFKTGLKKQYADIYDFMIDTDEDLSEEKLLSQILFYLSQIEPKIVS